MTHRPPIESPEGVLAYIASRLMILIMDREECIIPVDIPCRSFSDARLINIRKGSELH